MMKRLKFGTIILSLNIATSFAGVGSSGGGSGVVFKDGSVRIVDMLDRVVLQEEVSSLEQIQDEFFKKNRYVKQLAKEDNHFFDCAVKKITSSEVSHKEMWIKSLKDVRVLQLELPLISAKYKSVVSKQNLPLLADASDSQLVHQVALASYSKGDLWVQNRFYKRLSTEDKCALSIHEAIRHLNYYYDLKTPFSTLEIEQLTRGLMSDDISAIKKISQVESIEGFDSLKLKINSVINLKNKKNLPGNDYVLSVSASAKILYQQVLKVQLLPSSENLLELSKKIKIIVRDIDDYQDMFWSEISNKNHLLINKIQKRLLNETQHLLAKSMNRTSYEALATNNFWDRFFIGNALTDKLSGLKYYDLIKMKIVKKLFTK